MVNFGAAAVVLQDSQVLLVKREDFEVWVIPGGSIDPGESVSDAAVREVYEETGLQVHLTRLLGIYSRPHWSAHIAIFVAEPTAGTLRSQPGETIDIRFFDVQALPDDLVWWYRQPILDAIHGVGGSAAWSQDALWPSELDPHDRQALYDQRDNSGLSRSDFYAKYLGLIGPDGEHRAV